VLNYDNTYFYELHLHIVIAHVSRFENTN